MKKAKIIICSSIAIVLIIGIVTYMQVQAESDQEVRERAKAVIQQVQNNSEVYDKIDNELKANGFSNFESTGATYSRENELEFIINFPGGKDISPKNKEKVKNIASKILKKSNLSDMNFSIQIYPIEKN